MKHHNGWIVISYTSAREECAMCIVHSNKIMLRFLSSGVSVVQRDWPKKFGKRIWLENVNLHIVTSCCQGGSRV